MTASQPWITEELAELVWQESMVGCAIVSPEGLIKHANPRICELLGYSSTELHGMHFRAISHPEDVEADLSEFRALMKGEKDRYVFFKRYVHKQGHVVGMTLKCSIRRGQDGPDLILGQVADPMRVLPVPSKPSDDERKVLGAALGAALLDNWKLVLALLAFLLGAEHVLEMVLEKLR